MEKLYVTSLCHNYIDVIDIETFTIESTIKLPSNDYIKGISDMKFIDDKILIATEGSNFITVLDKDDLRKYQLINIYGCCSSLETNDGKIFALCNISNSLSVTDINNKEVVEIFRTGENPLGIDVSDKKIAISNFNNSSITIVDAKKDKITTFKVKGSPIKVKFYKGGEYLLVCEHQEQEDESGIFTVISIKENREIKKIPISSMPMDMFIEKNIVYISSYDAGIIDVVCLDKNKLIKRIKIGGLIRSVIKKDNNLYLLDDRASSIVKVDIDSCEKKVLSLSYNPAKFIIS